MTTAVRTNSDINALDLEYEFMSRKPDSFQDQSFKELEASDQLG